MKNANAPAMPIIDDEQSFPLNLDRYADNLGFGKFALGLTKREMMAMHIIGGLISGGHLKAYDAKQMPELAVLMADKLLEELERTNGK